MEYKSEKQKIALLKQSNFLKEFNKIFSLDQEEKIKSLYISGMSCNEIAKQFSCSKSPILRIIKDLPKRKAHQYNSHRSKNQFGENNSAWKGGMKSVYDRIRGLSQYWIWHHAILNRDNHICIKCSSKEKLEVHHIITLKTLVSEYSNKYNILPKDFTEKDLLSDHFYDLSNGITFCKKCHKDWHKSNGR